MYFIDFIVAVIVVIVLMRQNSRLAVLEQRLKNFDFKASTVMNQKTETIKTDWEADSTAKPIVMDGNNIVAYPDQGPLPVTPAVTETSPVTELPRVEKPATEASVGKWLGIIGVIAIAGSIIFLFGGALIAFIRDFAPAIGLFIGITLILIGHFTRSKYPDYSDTLMGGGIAVLYLSVVGAHSNSFNWIDETTTFVLMVFITAFSVMLSVMENTISLAIIGAIGGFAAPMVLSSGGGYIKIFSYVFILDLGIMIVALFKHWLNLTLVGLIGTICLVTGWVLSHYRPETDLWGVLFFISIFFGLFFIANLAHSILRRGYSSSEDLAFFTINIGQYAIWLYVLLHDKYDGYLGFIAVTLSVFTFVTAYLLLKVNEKDKAMTAYLPGLAVLFLTIAVPLQLSGNWITVAWLVEAVILMFIYGLLKKDYFRSYAIIVYTIGIMGTCYHLFSDNIGDVIVFNARFLTAALAVLVSYALISLIKNQTVSGVQVGEAENEVSIRSQLIGVFGVVATILTVWFVTVEIYGYYNIQKRVAIESYQNHVKSNTVYQFNNGYTDNSNIQTDLNVADYDNQANTLSSVFWAVYSLILITFGFAARSKYGRYLGLVLFALTIIKVFMQLWQFGVVSRVISTMVVGVIALLASFGYAKYKDRLNS